MKNIINIIQDVGKEFLRTPFCLPAQALMAYSLPTGA